MADKKISQFEDFYGSGDFATYFVIASGDSSDVNAKNYKWDFFIQSFINHLHST